MSDYIITVNSTVDTTREWLAERGVPYIPLKYGRSVFKRIL